MNSDLVNAADGRLVEKLYIFCVQRLMQIIHDSDISSR